jgi:RNA polymerase sigma factor (sigma-70 family)
VSLRKKSASAGLKVWTVAELGAFYTEHRSELVAHASRILKDSARAEEVIQDALIKVMLAAPELESADHALGYMHRTIENLCIDIFRIEGRRPNLVLLDDAASEVENTWVDNKDHADIIAAAEDAAIVRQALAMLSPAERAALVMWEMEGRSTAEIAAELGIKESAVRHTVSRARTSLRRVMSELVIDKERGLTALDMLSTTYKKASELAKKSSKAALSLILVFFAFLGFNSLQTSPSPVTPVVVQEEGKEVTPATSENTASASPSPVASKAKKDPLAAANIKRAELKIPGLDKSGIPQGFVVSDSSGNVGVLSTFSRALANNEFELVSSQILKTDTGAANVLLNQSLTTDGTGFTYDVILSYGSNGQWIPVQSKVLNVDIKRLLDGNYLMTAIVKVQSSSEDSIKLASQARGRDLASAPRQVITRAVLNADKTEVLAQIVYVVEKGATN